MYLRRNRAERSVENESAVDQSAQDERDNNHEYNQEQSQEEEYEPDYEETEALLLPSDGEKRHMIAMFQEMRKESFFCDVAFLCHGILFRAHRVVVSSWSRWLRALLCESPDEEVLSLDVFESTAFSQIIDYMYGVPLKITVETADSIIKVVRRLEMQKLEQQIWRYLMTIIDPHTNVELLHELADRYDCPPLKLAAWRILQETVPGYSLSPASKLLRRGGKEIVRNHADTGLTGPGEASFNINHDNRSMPNKLYNKVPANKNNGVLSDDEDAANYPSVFDNVEDEDEDEHSENSEDDESKSQFSKALKQYAHPDQLPASASASEVIKAWAARLKTVYDSCLPQDASDFQDPQGHFHLSRNNPNVKIIKTTVQYQQNATQQQVRGNYAQSQQSSQQGGGTSHKPSTLTQTAGLGGGERSRVGSGDVTSINSGDASRQQPQAPQGSPGKANIAGGGAGVGGSNKRSGGAPPAPPSITNSSPGQGSRVGPSTGAQQQPQNKKSNPAVGAGNSNPPMNKSPSATSHKAHTGPSSPSARDDHSSFTEKNQPNRFYLNRSKQLSAGRQIDFREELQRFYLAINLPEKIATIPTVLTTWEGREAEMIRTMITKYKATIPPHMILHLDQLQMILDNKN